VSLEDLEDAARILQGFIASRPVLRRAGPLRCVTAVGSCILVGFLRRTGVGPARIVVTAGAGIITREDPAVILRVDVLVADDRRRIGVGEDVLAEPEIVTQDIVDEATKKGDVSARADRDIEVGRSRGPGEARSTWMMVAPRSRAFIGQRNPTG
jgi:hypothetical protein